MGDIYLILPRAVPGGAASPFFPRRQHFFSVFEWLTALDILARFVESSAGFIGLLAIFIYSFLIAIALPLPSEIVLAPATQLGLGVSTPAAFAVVILTSAAGKTLGSVVAWGIGSRTSEYGSIGTYLKQSRFDILKWSENKAVDIAQSYGYVGLALALCVPGFPDTLSIYAFSVLETNYAKFALATFCGSVGRLVLILVWVGSAVSIL